MKNDLIKRQDVLDYIDNMPSELTSDGRRMVRRIMLTEYITDTLPSAQPEIIYCKDCKWSDWYDAADGHRYCYCMETGASGRTADDFCSYAEKEEA